MVEGLVVLSTRVGRVSHFIQIGTKFRVLRQPHNKIISLSFPRLSQIHHHANRMKMTHEFQFNYLQTQFEQLTNCHDAV